MTPNFVRQCIHQHALCPLPLARAFSAHQPLLTIGPQVNNNSFWLLILLLPVLPSPIANKPYKVAFCYFTAIISEHLLRAPSSC